MGQIIGIIIAIIMGAVLVSGAFTKMGSSTDAAKAQNLYEETAKLITSIQAFKATTISGDFTGFSVTALPGDYLTQMVHADGTAKGGITSSTITGTDILLTVADGSNDSTITDAATLAAGAGTQITFGVDVNKNAEITITQGTNASANVAKMFEQKWIGVSGKGAITVTDTSTNTGDGKFKLTVSK